jgi:hypothetical protein
VKKLLVLLALAQLCAFNLNATVMTPMYLDDLTGSSQTIAYATVTGKRTEWSADRRMIYTVYTVQAEQYLKGSLGASFEIREPGGERDGEGFYVASVPQYEIGQEAVLFVWTDPAGAHQVTAFEQGSVAIFTSAAGDKVPARRVPLGSYRLVESSSALVDSASEAAKVQPAVQLSEPSLAGLLNQIRVSVARTQPAQQ